MSYQATNWAKKQSTRSIEPRGHACKLLLMVLADYVSHDTGTASVTIGELSKASQMVKSTVHENLRKLENIGWRYQATKEGAAHWKAWRRYSRGYRKT